MKRSLRLHVAQVTVEDTSTMEPVDRIQAIQKERWELLCGVCRQRCGAKVHLVIIRPPCTICCSLLH